MRTHTITTKPPVEGEGRTERTIVPSGVLARSLAVALRMRRLCLPAVAGLVLVFSLASASAHTLSSGEARHETRLVARDFCERDDRCKSYEVTVCSRWGHHPAARHHAKCEFTLYKKSGEAPGYRWRCRTGLGWWLDAGSDEIRGPKRIRLFESGRQGCVDGW